MLYNCCFQQLFFFLFPDVAMPVQKINDCNGDQMLIFRLQVYIALHYASDPVRLSLSTCV